MWNCYLGAFLPARFSFIASFNAAFACFFAKTRSTGIGLRIALFVHCNRTKATIRLLYFCRSLEIRLTMRTTYTAPLVVLSVRRIVFGVTPWQTRSILSNQVSGTSIPAMEANCCNCALFVFCRNAEIDVCVFSSSSRFDKELMTDLARPLLIPPEFPNEFNKLFSPPNNMEAGFIPGWSRGALFDMIDSNSAALGLLVEADEAKPSVMDAAFVGRESDDEDSRISRPYSATAFRSPRKAADRAS